MNPHTLSHQFHGKFSLHKAWGGAAGSTCINNSFSLSLLLLQDRATSVMNGLGLCYPVLQQRDGLNDLLMSPPVLLFYDLEVITSPLFYFRTSVSAICFSFEVINLNF